MRTSSVAFALITAALVAGCGPGKGNSVASLPDTPVAPPPRTADTAKFDDAPGSKSGVASQVDTIQRKVEAADRALAHVPRQQDQTRSEPLIPIPESFTVQPRVAQEKPLYTPPRAAPPASPRVDTQEPSARTASQKMPRLFDKPSARPPEKESRVAVPEPVRVPEPKAAPLIVSPPAPPQDPVMLPTTRTVSEAADGPRFRSDEKTITSRATTDRDDMRRTLVQKVKDHPTDLTAHLNLQLYYYLMEQEVPHLESLSPLPAEQREMLVNLLNGMSNFRKTVQSDPDALPSRIVAPLLQMAELLRERTELSIPKIELCKEVKAYGIYVPLDHTFPAGLNHEAIIYCEIENFSSRLNGEMWETKLSMEAVLYNSVGDAILKGKDDIAPDLCRNRRRDFFVVKLLLLPDELPASRYILKVTIVDEQSKRIAENSLSIMIMAK